MADLDLGFAFLHLPEGVQASVVRAPDGGAIIGFIHDLAGEIGRVFLVPRPGGLQIDADIATPVSPDDAAWKRALLDPLIKSINDGIDRTLAERRRNAPTA